MKPTPAVKPEPKPEPKPSPTAIRHETLTKAATSIREAAVDYGTLAEDHASSEYSAPEIRRMLQKSVKIRENLIRSLRLYNGLPKGDVRINRRKVRSADCSIRWRR